MRNINSHILHEALRVTAERPSTHGSAEDNFAHTAAMWSAYLNAHVTPADVCQMMVLAKISRAKVGNQNVIDHYVDQCGYAALAGRMAINNLPNLAELEQAVKTVVNEQYDGVAPPVSGGKDDVVVPFEEKINASA